jgi:large subunit ribosomal protein LP0
MLKKLLHLFQTKEYLADPSKFAVAAPVAASSAPAETKKEEAKKEESEESDDDMGFGLFD